MDASKFLGKVIGIYLIIVSVAMFAHMHQFITGVNYLIHDAGLMFAMSFISIILGILMIVSHNVWQLNWRLLITLIGWLALLKGVCHMLYPQFIDQFTMSFMQNMYIAYTIAGIDLVIGLILSYYGCRSD